MNPFNAKKARAFIIKKGKLKFNGEINPVDNSVKELVREILLKSEIMASLNPDGSTHCGTYGARAISDIYRLLRTYRNETTLTETYKALRELGMEKKVCSYLCHAAKKKVYFINTQEGGIKFNTVLPDEFNFVYEEIPENHSDYCYGNHNTIDFENYQ